VNIVTALHENSDFDKPSVYVIEYRHNLKTANRSVRYRDHHVPVPPVK